MQEIIDEVVKEVYPLVIVDTETTRNDPDGGPDPFYPGNRIVMTGWQFLFDDTIDTCNGSSEFIHWVNTLASKITLVGYNIKFDLHYLRREGLDMSKIAGVIDLSLLVHYRSGSELIFPSLDEALEYVGIPDRKDDSIKKLWDDGVKTEDIDPEMLRKYLVQDIAVTRKLMDSIFTDSALENIMAKATLALAEIEYNGMFMDVPEVAKRIGGLGTDLMILENVLRAYAVTLLPGTDTTTINATSNTTVSTIVHGYPGVKVVTKVPAGTYKNGKPKFKREETRIFPPGPRTFPVETDLTKPGPVDEASLIKVKPLVDFAVGIYVDRLLEYRSKTKELETYYNPLYRASLIRGEPYMRAQLHQVGTRTGRTSSSKPNGQNLPASVREVLVSRYPDGEIMAADFNQLEVCGVAQLSEDSVLINHLTLGTDIHTEANGGVRGTPEDRRNVKGVVFGTFYGGGDKTLSEQTGLPIARVKKIRDSLRLMYPDAIGYNKKVKAELNKTAKNSGEVIDGFAEKVGTYTLPTGRNLSFRTKLQKIKDWTKGGVERLSMEWPHSQCCDRPIQGVSTGDLSQAFLGLVHEFMRNYDTEGWFNNVKIVMFAHDEVVFDIPADAPKAELTATLKVLAEQVLPQLYEDWTSTKWLTPLRLNVGFNKYWSK